jgi:transposase
VYEWQAKLAIVREAMVPGVSLARVALRNGINANLLRKWVVKHGEAASTTASTPKPPLLPVVVVPGVTPTVAKRPVPARQHDSTARERTPIEIDLPRGVLRFYGSIDRAVLREVIEALSLR